MLLSIGLIVKNEEKYLEGCLNALKPILDNVDSELIIADTGSTDDTVEIAKRFTDNVFYFEWINDFAAARNSTLDKAKGEWYMFIDADEYLVDCTEIIEFFNSGEYKHYGSGTYTIKNYNDLSNMDLFSTYNAHRLTALKEGVRFAKPIHEQFDHYFLPVKNFNVIADHYGYVFKDNGKKLDLIEEKTSRNLELLFTELEESKKTDSVKPTVYGQIADCYLVLDQLDEAMKYIDMGLENCDPKSLTIIGYYIKKIKVLNSLGKNQEVVEVCQKYFSKENPARPMKLVSDCNVYFFWAASCYALGNLDESINKAILGFDIYKNYRSGKFYTADLNFVSMEANVPMLKQMCNMMIVACIIQKRYNDATSQLPNIPLEDFMSDEQFMRSHLNIRNMFMDKTNYNKLPELYYSLDKPNREIYKNILVRHIFKAEKQEQLLKKLSALANEINDERFTDIVSMYESYFTHHDLYPAQTTEFIKKYGAKNNEAIWILMMKNHFDITPFICADDFEVEQSVDELYDNVEQPASAMDLFEGSIYTLSKEGIDKAVEAFGRAVYVATAKRYNTSKVIRAFSLLGKRWTDLNPDNEPSEAVAFALTLDEISNLHRKKHYDEAVARINIEEMFGAGSETLNDSDPETSDENNTNWLTESHKSEILHHYLVIIQEEKKRITEMKEKHDEDPMMNELAEQIKQEIRLMIENWDLDGAEEALNKMASMAPFDSEIENIRDEITDRKINYMNYM